MNDSSVHRDAANARSLVGSPPGWSAKLSSVVVNEARAWATALRCWQLYVLLVVLFGGLVAATQLPLRYRIDVGIGEGYGGDLPLLRGFNDAEQDDHGSYRWTTDNATIRLPGVGVRPLLVRMSFFPIGGTVLEQGPKVIEIWSHATHVASLPVRPEGATYNIPVAAPLVADGDLELTIRTATFAPGGDDPRRLGTPLDRIELIALDSQGLAAPNWRTMLAWIGALIMLWLVLLRAGFRTGESMLALGVVVFLALVAAVLDPPRFAFGALPTLQTALLSYGLLLLLRVAVPWLAHVLAVPLDERVLRWLLIISVVAFGLRYGGRLYPDSMGGDIGFHYNRFTEVIKGRVFILSRNRGVDFPYPPGPYLALAPFVTLGIDPRTLLQLGAALLEGISAVLVYAIVAVTFGQRKDQTQDQNTTAVLAAALYVFTAAGFMTTWWSFDTHIYTQFVSLLLATTVVLSARGWAYPKPNRPAAGHLALIFLFLSGVFLGHFGFFINTVLLGGGLLTIAWLLTWRKRTWASVAGPFTLVYIGAGLVAALFFYSAFLPLFIEQVTAAANGGLTGLAQRAPVPRAVLWQVLWQAGFVVHFGFFPLLLAPIGLYSLVGRKTKNERRKTISDPDLSSFVLRPSLVLIALIAGSFLVSSIFAILPFITQSTQSTRWLMFSAWAVAVSGALAARILWRCGRAGQLIVLTMGGFVLWNTLSLWLGALAWRIRPPEPF